MPFTFRVDKVEYEEPGNTVLTGYLQSGELTGPEFVMVPTASGQPFESQIIAMEVKGPMAMPLPASQGSEIQLVLHGHPPGKDVTPSCIATARLPDQPPSRQLVERSDLLGNPLFWAMWYYMHIGTEERDSAELMEPFFGLSNEEVNQFYVANFSRDDPHAPWLSIKLPLPDGFSLSVEFAETYSEDRYTLSHADWNSSVLLGYHSGHFALPALRWNEVAAIGRCAALTSLDENHRRVALLLFFPGVYLTDMDTIAEVRSTLIAAWETLGLVKQTHIQEMVDQIIDGKVIDDLRWWRDPDLGWINDGRYSLRNPRTRMCEFDKAKFERISAFLSMLERFAAPVDNQ
jgi:hypothetical protein